MNTIVKLPPRAQELVWIIICAVRQDSGDFSASVECVFSTHEGAKAELERIAKRIGKGDATTHWRATTPSGQPDDLAIEFQRDGAWTCQILYKVVTKPVN